jgi:hypothetical protein
MLSETLIESMFSAIERYGTGSSMEHILPHDAGETPRARAAGA